MERISEEILEEIRKEIVGKRIFCEADDGEHRGICTFIGYNPHMPIWNLQINIGRTPITNVKLSSIRVLDEHKPLFSK